MLLKTPKASQWRHKAKHFSIQPGTLLPRVSLAAKGCT